jgi:SAM-dependent methyltransferase
MGDERWQVTGSAAEVYERQLVPAIFGPWAPRVLDLAAPATGQRVLDSACGTGVVARLAADRVGPTGHVVGQDLNPGMLAVASAGPAGAAPIAWVQASTDHLPFAGRTFDLAGGGFEDVSVRRSAGTVRFSSIQEFVLAQGTGSPLAAPIAAADPAARAALLADAETTLASWRTPDGLAFPIEALLLSAQRSGHAF